MNVEELEFLEILKARLVFIRIGVVCFVLFVLYPSFSNNNSFVIKYFKILYQLSLDLRDQNRQSCRNRIYE